MRKPIHPEAVTGEPQAIRWVVDTGELLVGEVLHAAGTLGPMMQYGVITRMFVERGSVWTWLSPEHSWTDHGPRIRDAVVAAVDTDGWDITDGSADLLRFIADDVVHGQLLTFINSHGGQISVVSASIDAVVLDFGGACTDCPAQGRTLHDRVEVALVARYPQLRDVSKVASTHSPTSRPQSPLLRLMKR
ncbi:MAG: NifU family protein [Propionibacteriaceae bacterium]|nr:NifU family protein [Propionibacteriaceae bacterium]